MTNVLTDPLYVLSQTQNMQKDMQIEELKSILRSINWKSADKDNMEFEAKITYYQMDNIRKALDND